MTAAATVTRGATTPLTPLLLRAELPAEVLVVPVQVVIVVMVVVLLL